MFNFKIKIINKKMVSSKLVITIYATGSPLSVLHGASIYNFKIINKNDNYIKNDV